MTRIDTGSRPPQTHTAQSKDSILVISTQDFLSRSFICLREISSFETTPEISTENGEHGERMRTGPVQRQDAQPAAYLADSRGSKYLHTGQYLRSMHLHTCRLRCVRREGVLARRRV